MLTYQYINKNNIPVKVSEIQSEVAHFACFIVQFKTIDMTDWSTPHIEIYKTLKDAVEASNEF